MFTKYVTWYQLGFFRGVREHLGSFAVTTLSRVKGRFFVVWPTLCRSTTRCENFERYRNAHFLSFTIISCTSRCMPEWSPLFIDIRVWQWTIDFLKNQLGNCGAAVRSHRPGDVTHKWLVWLLNIAVVLALATLSWDSALIEVFFRSPRPFQVLRCSLAWFVTALSCNVSKNLFVR